MDTRWTGQATGGGLLPDARRALASAGGELDRLGQETAWECAAARGFRAELDGLRVQVEFVRRAAEGLEDELSVVWRHAMMMVG